MSQIGLKDRIEQVGERVARAAERAGRPPGDVTIVGATKMVPPEAIAEASALGLRDFGENYVQEAAAKRDTLGTSIPPGMRWHLIGQLQTNKVKAALELFDIIQTVDRLRIAEAIAHRALRDVPILLEVTFSNAPERVGFKPREVVEAVRRIDLLPRLVVQGLMTVPPLGLTPLEMRRVFRELRSLREEVVSVFPGLGPQHLSMGMTDDYEIAVEEGATIVRIGRAIFGERPVR